MGKYDHSQDTIDVKSLFHQASADGSFDPAAPLDQEQGDCAPEDVLPDNSQPARDYHGIPQNQMTQTIPQDYNVPPVASNSHPSQNYSNDEEVLVPEDLDDETFDPEQKDPEQEKKRKVLIICICAGVLTVLLGLIGLIVFIASGDGGDDPSDKTAGAANLIYDNVFAGGIDLSGKSLEQAKNLLHLKTDHTFSQKDMVIKLPGSSINLTPEKTGAALDVDAVAEAAFNCGRDGSVSEDGTYNIALLPYLNLDLEYIQDTIDTFCATYSSVKTDPVVKVEGSRPQFDPENPDREIEHQTLRITLGTPDYVLDAEDLYKQVLDAYSMNQLVLEYAAPDLTEPESVDVTALYEQYCTAPQDATIDPATYEITPEIYGYGFDPEQLQEMIDNAYYGETVEITFSYLTPAVLSSDFSKDMFVDTLAEYQISSNMDDSKRSNNLSLSCDAINEYIVNAGDTFSFNAALGKISTRNGYATAPISELNGSVMGGGISQTASALYACALVANLDIVERHSHEYAIDFCELGLDAFVDGDANDLRFRNNTNAPIRILAENDDGRVRVQILGTNNLDYEVEIISKTVSQNKPLTTYQNMEYGNALGYADGDILQKGVTGYVVELYMEKYDLETGNLLTTLRVSTSEYAKVDEVVVRIAPVVTDPTVPDDVTDPTDNTETTEPTEVTEPSQATEPTETTTPSSPSESTEVTDATDPTQAADGSIADEEPILENSAAPAA